MPNRAATLTQLLVVAVIGFLAGLLGGASFAGTRTPPPGSAGTPDLSALLDELRALRQDLRATDAPARGTGAVERRAITPGQPAPDAAQLAATVAELVRAVEALAARADVLGLQQAGGAGVFEQIANRAGRDLPSLTAVARAVNADYEAAQAPWMFVPATEVLRRFGRPTRITAGKGNGMLWNYEFEAEGKGWWVGFTIADGVVVRVD